MPDKNIVNDAIIKDISDSIHSLKYGEIIIKVHNSRIVQIDISKKNRFDEIWQLEEGGGI